MVTVFILKLHQVYIQLINQTKKKREQNILHCLRLKSLGVLLEKEGRKSLFKTRL